jgi:hypothetical protein
MRAVKRPARPTKTAVRNMTNARRKKPTPDGTGAARTWSRKIRTLASAVRSGMTTRTLGRATQTWQTTHRTWVHAIQAWGKTRPAWAHATRAAKKIRRPWGRAARTGGPNRHAGRAMRAAAQRSLPWTNTARTWRKTIHPWERVVRLWQKMIPTAARARPWTQACRRAAHATRTATTAQPWTSRTWPDATRAGKMARRNVKKMSWMRRAGSASCEFSGNGAAGIGGLPGLGNVKKPT